MYGEHGFQLGVFVHRDGGVSGLTECEDQRDFFGSGLGGELNGGPERALFSCYDSWRTIATLFLCIFHCLGMVILEE